MQYGHLWKIHIPTHSPENGFQIRAGGMKSRVNISSLDAPNAPNRRAPTVNVVKDNFSVLVSLLFML